MESRQPEESLSVKRIPVSVYRLQFSRSFTFSDASRLVSYLHDLGITDCYCSPYLQARPGSPHGYDITDHNKLNPELGPEDRYREFIRELTARKMGHILDFVPNHMSIFDNGKWYDVLENGPASPYARYFDIDWEPVKPELESRVLLPILGDLYGRALENGEISLALEEGAFTIKYGGHTLPVDPGTFCFIIESFGEEARQHLGDGNIDYLELRSIETASRNLPRRNETAPERVAERLRENEVIKRRLASLQSKSAGIRLCIKDAVLKFNGSPGNALSFRLLHGLLEQQAYRLSYWQVASDEINYRRFFVINELVGLRVEDPAVFEETHRLVTRLASEGTLTGIRVDHVDGLYDPRRYLERLQQTLCGRLRMDGDNDETPSAVESATGSVTARPDCRSEGHFYMVVEKVLAEDESLPRNWPVDGTTGYEFGAALDAIFVDSRHRRSILELYLNITGSADSFDDIAYRSKKLVLTTALASPLWSLARHLNRISEMTWQYRDFTLNSLREAIEETIACFPVYRTYTDSECGPVNEADAAVVHRAVSEAMRRNPAMPPALLDFLKSILLIERPEEMSEESSVELRTFVARFQQLTGPVMAKGVEDTAFYLYCPLLSLCEVGSSPARFGLSVQRFHKANLERLARTPNSLLTTSTHDSKRSQDVRARINVLSEMPGLWGSTVRKWCRLNNGAKVAVSGGAAPDRNEEYMLYQTLLGSYPAKTQGESGALQYLERLKDLTTKALREAKVHSSWIAPAEPYEKAVHTFLDRILQPGSRFLEVFMPLNSLVARYGAFNSLSQTVLKVFSPGVPDIYQGDELWCFNLVDPDNRRPVDFAGRRALLDQLRTEQLQKGPQRLASNLLQDPTDDTVKLYVVHKSLDFRRRQPALFREGDYIPLQAAGSKRTHVVAFARRLNDAEIIVVVPRLIARLTGRTGDAPVGEAHWGNSSLLLKRHFAGHRYRDLYTGVELCVPSRARPALSLSDVFRNFPVAALERTA